MSDVEKTKEAILEIFKRDDTSAPEALFLLSVMAARIIAGTCKSPRDVKQKAEKYFCDVIESIGFSAQCDCPDCRRHLN
jgi:hypothetical protein